MQRRSFLKAAGSAALAALVPLRARAGDLVPLVFATDWKAQAEQGGFYQALAEGTYRRHGLDVRILQGGPQINTQQIIASGAVDLGMGSNSIMVLNFANMGAPVKAVMASFQKDPQVLITRRRDDIRGIADMKDKPILLGSDSLGTFWVWLKAKYGFTDAQIRPYTYSLAPFLADPSLIQQGYLGSEPFTIRKEGGFEPEIFLLADEGYPGYSAMVVASERLINRQPDVVQAFVDATIEGWASYVHGDPAPGNALIKKDNPDMTADLLAYGIARMRERGIVDGGEAATLGIGAMSDTRWKESFDVMVQAGLYPADLDYRNAYTLQFVNKGYSLKRKG